MSPRVWTVLKLRIALCSFSGMTQTESNQIKDDASDADVLAALTKMLEARIPVMGEQGLSKLQAECSAEGRERLATNPQHQEGTTERWAWHAGYVTAMNDALGMIQNRVSKYPIEDEG